jgi:GH15 family glucan-1,4-alpha-glucosidase
MEKSFVHFHFTFFFALVSPITTLEKNYNDTIRATKELYQGMIERLNTYQNEILSFLQKQCTTMTTLLDDNMRLVSSLKNDIDHFC